MINEVDLRSLNLKNIIEESPYQYKNRNVARVTSILSKMISEENYIYWANKLGLDGEKYSQVMKYYQDFGTATHYGIECFLKNEPVPQDTPLFPFTQFMEWWSKLNKDYKEVKVLGQEEELVGPYYGGKYDLMMSVDNKVWLVDFKTSSKVTYKYFLQLAAYTTLLESMNRRVDGLLVLQLPRNDNAKYKEYYLDRSYQPHEEYLNMCKRTFESMVYTYYHTIRLEEEFKNEWVKNISREVRSSQSK